MRKARAKSKAPVKARRKSTRARKRIAGDYSDDRYRKRALRILASFERGKPDKGKKWVEQEDHDRALYAGFNG